MSTRIAAWLVTGPLGHAAAGLLEWIELLARYGWARARGRRLEAPAADADATSGRPAGPGTP